MQISGRVVRAGGRNPMGESEMFDCRGFFEVPREQYASALSRFIVGNNPHEIWKANHGRFCLNHQPFIGT
jgi:hypothetical protein